MKKMFLAALLCCSLLGAAHAQTQSKNGSSRTDCTTRESGWSVDIGGVRGGDVTRESHCETRGDNSKGPKEPSGPKEPKAPKEPKDRNR